MTSDRVQRLLDALEKKRQEQIETPTEESNINIKEPTETSLEEDDYDFFKIEEKENKEMTPEEEEELYSKQTWRLERFSRKNKKELNSEELLAEKIEHEKRIRNQLYKTLEYHLNLVSDMDFFSFDAIRIIETSKRLARYFKQPAVTCEIFLLSFFFSESSSLDLVKKDFLTLESAVSLYGELRVQEKEKITRRNVLEIKKIIDNEKRLASFLKKLWQEKLFRTFIEVFVFPVFKKNPFSAPFFDFVFYFSQKVKNITEYSWKYCVFLDKEFESVLEFLLPHFYKKKKEKIPDIPFSLAVEKLLDKAVLQAVSRYRTPIITTDLLFVVLVEKILFYLSPNWNSLNQNEKISKKCNESEKEFRKTARWFSNVFPKDVEVELLLLRYDLFKQIHKGEASLREQISVNQYFFGSIIKTEIPESKINELLENESFGSVVSEFRDILMKTAMEKNLQDQIYQDSLKELHLTSNRKYSSF